jgi:hemerythrin superfamily protein
MIQTTQKELTKDELYERAQELDIEGRSSMTKDELADAVQTKETGPDAVRLILEQHEQIRDRFSAFESLSDRPSQKKEDTVREIITLLSKHAAIEEQLFYPVALDLLPDLAEHVREDLEEHRLVELALLELDHASVHSERYNAKVRVVIENVRHHLEEEEEELLPAIREQVDEETRRKLGAAMAAAWETAPTRPHPLTPENPLVKIVTGAPVAVYDWTVNALRTARKMIGR